MKNEVKFLKKTSKNEVFIGLQHENSCFVGG